MNFNTLNTKMSIISNSLTGNMKDELEYNFLVHFQMLNKYINIRSGMDTLLFVEVTYPLVRHQVFSHIKFYWLFFWIGIFL